MDTHILDADGFVANDEPTDPRRANAALREGNEAIDHIAAARKATYIVTGLTFAYGVYAWFAVEPAFGAGVAFEAVLLGGLALLAPRAPRTALAIIAAIYVAEFAYMTLFEAWNSWGFGIRLGVSYLLVRGAIGAFRLPGWSRRVVEAGGAAVRTEPWTRLLRVRLYAVAPAEAA